MSEIMKKIRIEKITLNIGTGKPGLELEKALKLLERVSGKKPVETKSMKRIPTWGVRPGLTIGAKVTLRGENAKEVLKLLLQSQDLMLSQRNFDSQGNLSFGISEYLDMPNMEYDPDIGMMGLECAVTLCRPGVRITRRHLFKKKLPQRQKITKEEAIKFMKENFEMKLKEEEETEE